MVIPTEKNELIKQLIESLRPFEAVTTELSAERNVSASKIIPLARGLQKITASANNMTPFHQELVSHMATRFTGIEEKHVTAIATLMDPRFKKIPFTSNGTVERMKQRIISDASALAASGPEPPTEEAGSVVGTRNPVWKVFEEQAAASRSRNHPTINAFSELEQYFKLPILPRKEDPLVWWKQKSNVFPLIQNIAQVYFSVVATSVPSKQLFSKAGELISTRRNRIKPKNVKMMLFLNKYC